MHFKNVILRGLIGVPIGIALSVTIPLCISLSFGELMLVPPEMLEHFNGCELSAFTNQYILSCIIGFTFAAASCIFEVDQWSMALQTFIHFLIVSLVFLPVSILAGWMGTTPLAIAIYFAIFIMIYLTIWLIQYFSWKRKIKRLNQQLKKTS